MGDTWFEFSIGDALRISRQGLSDTPSLVRVHEDKTACPRQWSTRLSKLTHHPLELPMTAVPHGCVQFVRIDGTSAPAGSVTDTFVRLNQVASVAPTAAAPPVVRCP